MLHNAMLKKLGRLPELIPVPLGHLLLKRFRIVLYHAPQNLNHLISESYCLLI